MFEKIKEICRMVGGVGEEREDKKKIVNHLIFVRKGSRIDVEKLESLGFHVIEGGFIEEGKDFRFIDKTQIVTTIYSREVEKEKV